MFNVFSIWIFFKNVCGAYLLNCNEFMCGRFDILLYTCTYLPCVLFATKHWQVKLVCVDTYKQIITVDVYTDFVKLTNSLHRNVVLNTKQVEIVSINRE